MAKKFKFYLDQKVTVWNRTSFEISADSEEEAKEIARRQFLNKEGENEVAESDDDVVEFIDTESLYETEKPMSIEENSGNPTLELYINSISPSDLVADNTTI